MKTTLLAVALLVISAPAYATCKTDATDKKLAGAALNSFMKKCETDAKTACEKSAADLKLAGAARTSHVNKCVKDTVGA
jgi:hypothetical protein